jgi:hypothetical protein
MIKTSLKNSLCSLLSLRSVKGETLRFVKGETLRFVKGETLRFIKPLLGRWTIHNSKETSLKIKYANEDNCGVCCNNYNGLITHTPGNIKFAKSLNTTVTQNDDDFIYAMGYESVHN